MNVMWCFLIEDITINYLSQTAVANVEEERKER